MHPVDAAAHGAAWLTPAARPAAPGPHSGHTDSSATSALHQDTATISGAARSALANATKNDGKTGSGQQELTPEERKQVEKLKARDREVRAHEQAHKAAAGDLAVGGPTYTYQVGPDGRRYAIGGEVKIKIPKGRTPEESLRIAQRAQRAALAPQEPSSQDRAVAARAAQRASEARSDMRSGEDEESEPGNPQGTDEAAAEDPLRRTLDALV